MTQSIFLSIILSIANYKKGKTMKKQNNRNLTIPKSMQDPETLLRLCHYGVDLQTVCDTTEQKPNDKNLTIPKSMQDPEVLLRLYHYGIDLQNNIKNKEIEKVPAR